jgi:hypothetical protein
MRVIDTIPHPRLSISIFSMNDKYQVQFVAGLMEQTFKFYHDEVKGVSGLKAVIDDEFIEKVLARFNEMFLAFKDAKERNKQDV